MIPCLLLRGAWINVSNNIVQAGQVNILMNILTISITSSGSSAKDCILANTAMTSAVALIRCNATGRVIKMPLGE